METQVKENEEALEMDRREAVARHAPAASGQPMANKTRVAVSRVLKGKVENLQTYVDAADEEEWLVKSEEFRIS